MTISRWLAGEQIAFDHDAGRVTTHPKGATVRLEWSDALEAITLYDPSFAASYRDTVEQFRPAGRREARSLDDSLT